MPSCRELPPTAGLPFKASDFLPGSTDLAGRIATLLDTPPLQLECSGTAALRVALHTLIRREPARRAVVVPAYTCPLVAIAVHSLGLKLRLCDLAPGHFDLDPTALARLCDAQTLAVLPTHLGGRVADVATACRLAHKVGAYVIEDAAQALGARAQGQSVGLAGDIGFFSLAAGKGLSIFEGGLLITHDPELREELRQTSRDLVPYHPGWELRRSIELLGLAWFYHPTRLATVYGNPLRDALLAGNAIEAVGDRFPEHIPCHRVGCWRRMVGARAALRLPALLGRQRQLARLRQAHLAAIPGITVFDDANDTQGTWAMLLVQLPSRAQRDAALQELWTCGLGVSRLFIHALTEYAYLTPIVPRSDVPNARDFAARSLSIGNSDWLSEPEFTRIVTVLAQHTQAPS